MKKEAGQSESSAVSLCVCLQEFFDLWPVLMGEVPPYDGPKTPDGRVRRKLHLLLFICMFACFSTTPAKPNYTPSALKWTRFRPIMLYQFIFTVFSS